MVPCRFDLNIISSYFNKIILRKMFKVNVTFSMFDSLKAGTGAIWLYTFVNKLPDYVSSGIVSKSEHK